MTGRTLAAPASPADTQASAARARAIVMEVERALGFDPTDREFEKLGYDIESRVTGTGRLRFIEVKGRVSGADTVTVTKNEILTSLNKPDDFILAMVEFLADGSHCVKYLRSPFHKEPDFGVTSVNYNFSELLVRASQHDTNLFPRNFEATACADHDQAARGPRRYSACEPSVAAPQAVGGAG